jgi:hypothetical protein
VRVIYAVDPELDKVLADKTQIQQVVPTFIYRSVEKQAAPINISMWPLPHRGRMRRE